MSRQRTLNLEEVQQAAQTAIASRLSSTAFNMDDRISDLGISCCRGLIGDIARHFGQSFVEIKNENDHDLTGNQLAQLIWEQYFSPKETTTPA